MHFTIILFFWVREAPAVAAVRMWISLHVLYSDLLGRAVPSTCTIHPGTSYWAADCRSSLRASDSSDDLLVRFSSFYSRLPPSWELQAAFSVTLYLALFVCFFSYSLPRRLSPIFDLQPIIWFTCKSLENLPGGLWPPDSVKQKANWLNTAAAITTIHFYCLG